MTKTSNGGKKLHLCAASALAALTLVGAPLAVMAGPAQAAVDAPQAGGGDDIPTKSACDYVDTDYAVCLRWYRGPNRVEAVAHNYTNRRIDIEMNLTNHGWHKMRTRTVGAHKTWIIQKAPVKSGQEVCAFMSIPPGLAWWPYGVCFDI